MIASRFTIIWKSYKPQYPLLVTKEVYDYYKYELPKKIPEIRFGFLKEFYPEIIIISVGIIFLLADTYHWYARGGAIEMVGVIVFVIAIVTTLSFIISAISFTSSYIISKEYASTLNKAIKNSTSYNNFCELMSKNDKSYLLQIQRMKNEKSL